jgi:hypothetical protein
MSLILGLSLFVGVLTAESLCSGSGTIALLFRLMLVMCAGLTDELPHLALLRPPHRGTAAAGGLAVVLVR